MERRDSTRLTPGEGRKFAFTVGTAFLVLAAVLYWWRGNGTAAAAVGSLGAVLVTAGVVIPGRLGPVWRAWMRLALAISKVTTPIFLSIVYYLVLTPTGVLRRAIGQNPVRHPAKDGSYWARRPLDRRRSDLRRQF